MKTLNQLTKKELIKYITEIRPKADAYDRVCEQLGIKDNILSYVNKLKKVPPLVVKLIGEHNLRVNLGVKEAGLHKWIIQTIKKFYPQTEGSFAEN
jgi:hypothetical protein